MTTMVPTPIVDEDQLIIGRILGKGGFCEVMEIEKVKIRGLLVDPIESLYSSSQHKPNPPPLASPDSTITESRHNVFISANGSSPRSNDNSFGPNMAQDDPTRITMLHHGTAPRKTGLCSPHPKLNREGKLMSHCQQREDQMIKTHFPAQPLQKECYLLENITNSSTNNPNIRNDVEQSIANIDKKIMTEEGLHRRSRTIDEGFFPPPLKAGVSTERKLPRSASCGAAPHSTNAIVGPIMAPPHEKDAVLASPPETIAEKEKGGFPRRLKHILPLRRSQSCSTSELVNPPGDVPRARSFPKPLTRILSFSSGGTTKRTSSTGGLVSPKPSSDGLNIRRRKMLLKGRKPSRRNCYVLKRVQSDLKINCPGVYSRGLDDLANEAHLLSTLKHEHIIALCGVSMFGPSDFVVLARLRETLTKRIEGWAKQEEQLQKGASSRLGQQAGDSSYTSRVTAALDIASACRYLHDCDIIFRDLKPDNVGFDYAGTLKLFDFGMAKKLDDSKLTDDGINYHLTGMTGSLRYMAPEVGLSKPYNQSVDVYSWALVLWQLLKLESPFGSNCTREFVTEHVFSNSSIRPIVFLHLWSDPLCCLLELGWGDDPAARPTFAVIQKILRQELADMSSSSLHQNSLSSLGDSVHSSVSTDGSFDWML
eukprot:CAMPEP_0117044208 /NCGR_PEP_ID=MMETSP0472-20121206/30664_1 /TAXON_ID=693140 ORGANISM="Tiarina fusus, Strain LIS" /NCGR_SAMPLE_ID=MMETSP0472 /ASSEMBLY_ACC=CAM_ASM_000603 /LENGTH=650 /DNA_ID=CAMNT_0004755899 /DNA_START=116 /DNA_END=2069 /DNA_ORIENTATION=-